MATEGKGQAQQISFQLRRFHPGRDQTNYIWNRLWTFHSENQDIPTEYLSFFIISLIGLGINNLTIYILANRLKWNFYFSKLCATSCRNGLELYDEPPGHFPIIHPSYRKSRLQGR